MGDENSKNPNTVGSKGYRDSIIRKVSDDDKDTVFTSENESNAEKAIDDVASDESFVEVAKGKIAPTLNAGNPDIEKFTEGQRHSFEHPAMANKDETLKDALSMQVDKPADKNKGVY